MREFTYADDVVATPIASGDEPAADGRTLDVGGGASVSLSEAVDLVEQLTGRAVRRESVPLPAGDPPFTMADLEPARRLLGWSPTTTLRQGLEAQYLWHVQRAAVLTAA